jgi:hypothetical protein
MRPGAHARTLIGCVRAAFRLERGDLAGAEQALEQAYAAAVEARDLPILAVVAVHVASLAGARGWQDEAAVLLGAAARLRGALDRTDPQGRQISRRGRLALGEKGFGTAYEKGWNLDVGAAAAAVSNQVAWGPPGSA